MRVFRVKQRFTRSGTAGKHRDYLGVDKFKMYAPDVIRRYDGVSFREMFPNRYWDSIAEVYEMVDNRWQQLTEEEVNNILNS